VDRRKVTPSHTLPIAPEEEAVKLAIVGNLNFKSEQINLYENCPRRFFYTHILEIGGRRTTTAFMQMHEAVRTIINGVIDGAGPVGSEDELKLRVADAFSKHGLADHGYVNDYKTFALGMVRYFARTREGQTPENPKGLSVAFGNEQIVVRPDDVLLRRDGRRTLRSIRTGHQGSADSEDVAAAAFMLAAQQAFPGAIVELVYLSDEKAEPLVMSPRKLETRRQKLDNFFKEIRLGKFPTNPSPRVCPRCPAFFLCGPTPNGVLQKKF
jgi:hypothetical protein